MRKEPIQVGDYVHVYNRGNRKQVIVKNTQDSWRFLQALRFFNDTHSSLNILRQIQVQQLQLQAQASPLLTPSVNSELQLQADTMFRLGWPKDWPEKNPLVKILCYCLVPNHFHLLLKEIIEGGISKFMQKLGLGYTKYSNIKYEEVGRLFQGPYQYKLVGDDQIYLEYLSTYIQVKNVLELFPGGIQAAEKNINQAMKFLEEYIFSSCPDFLGVRKSLIIDKDVLGEIFPTPGDYRKFVVDLIKSGELEHEVIKKYTIEE